MEHFGKIQQLEAKLTSNKLNTYKQMEKTYKQLLKLKNEELQQSSQSCLHKQLMHKSKLNCKKNCLRQIQRKSNPKIKCGCKSFPLPFDGYKDC